MKKSLPAVSLSVLAISVLLAFQNCAEPLPHGAVIYEQGMGSGGTPLPGTPGPLPTLPSSANWVAGDAFNYPDLPAAMQSQMVLTQLVELGYAGYTGPKAVAVSASGLGMVRRALAGVTQAQVEKMALDSCYAISGGQPCMVIAYGNAWKVSRATLNNPFTYKLAAPTTISAATIPFLAPADAASGASSYNSAATPKAMAVSMDGNYMWVAQSASSPLADLAEARRLALERCELAAGAIPCTLFAENATVVFTPANVNRTFAIDYARTSVSTNIPGMKAATYNTYVRDNYLLNGGTTMGSIFISASGSAGIYYGTVDAEQQAKSYCESTVSPGLPCFKYAVNAAIQPVAANTASRRIYGLNMHCKVVPRISCAAHRTSGCPVGQYYTIQSSNVVLTSCP